MAEAEEARRHWVVVGVEDPLEEVEELNLQEAEVEVHHRLRDGCPYCSIIVKKAQIQK